MTRALLVVLTLTLLTLSAPPVAQAQKPTPPPTPAPPKPTSPPTPTSIPPTPTTPPRPLPTHTPAPTDTPTCTPAPIDTSTHTHTHTPTPRPTGTATRAATPTPSLTPTQSAFFVPSITQPQVGLLDVQLLPYLLPGLALALLAVAVVSLTRALRSHRRSCVPSHLPTSSHSRTLPEAIGTAASESIDTPEEAASAAAAESLAQASIPRSPVIATIHTDQVGVVQPAGVPSMLDVDEHVSRVLAKDESACALQVYAFGGGRVVRDGYPVSASDWQWATVREMFFYILLYGPLDRDAIGAVFWPNLIARKVKNNFHNAMTRMRKAVGANAVVMEDGLYRIEEDYWFDVEEFEALVERARSLSPQAWQKESMWRRAATLYQGAFLPEANGAWCVATRETCQEMYLDVLIGVGRCREAQEKSGGKRSGGMKG